MKSKTYRRLGNRHHPRHCCRPDGVLPSLSLTCTFSVRWWASFPTLQWQIIARVIGSTFILLLGLSLTLRSDRLRPELQGGNCSGNTWCAASSCWPRGLLITAITYFIVGPQRLVVFGILHLSGISTILAYPFLRSRWACLVGGILAITTAPISHPHRNPFPPGCCGWVSASSPTIRSTGTPSCPGLAWRCWGGFLGFTLYPERSPLLLTCLALGSAPGRPRSPCAPWAFWGGIRWSSTWSTSRF